MRARSVQYSFFGRPTRLFLMEARMFGLPVRALHVHRQESATFTVRVASAVNIVDLSGEQISAAETVTVLHDMCLMATGALVDPRLARHAVDGLTAEVTFTNGPHVVTAALSSTTAASWWISGPTTAPAAVAGASSPCVGRLRSASTTTSPAGTWSIVAMSSTTGRTVRSPTGNSPFGRSSTTSSDPLLAGSSQY